MKNMKKIGVCVAVLAGAAEIAEITAKSVENMRKKWFLRGVETGKVIGSITAAEKFTHEKTMIQQKYDKLCEEYHELEESYNEMLDYYAEDDE